MRDRYRPRGIRVSRGFSHAEMESHARVFRELLGLDDESINGLELFEQLSRIDGLAPLAVEYAVARLGSGIEAKTHYDRQKGQVVVTLSDHTYRQLEEHNPRALFTIAHEVGHVRLHLHEIVKLSSDIHPGLARGRLTHPPYEDSEWQADAFAAAFLMPVTALRQMHHGGRLSAEEVAKRFGVSDGAARLRIKNYARRFKP